MNTPIKISTSVPGKPRSKTYTAALVVKAERNTAPLKEASGNGAGTDHRQRDLPGLCANAACRVADPGHDEGIRHEPRGRDQRCHVDAPAVERIYDRGAGGRHNRVLMF